MCIYLGVHYTSRIFLLQILSHDITDEPLMKERAFSVSPGLYSLVALERTVVGSQSPGRNFTYDMREKSVRKMVIDGDHFACKCLSNYRR